MICEDCLKESIRLKAESKEPDKVEEVYEAIVRLPLYVYPPTGAAVRIGYVDKCLRCNKNYRFVWENTIEKYSSQRIKDMLMKENQGKYTRGITEAEICSPKAFEINEETDTDFFSYARRFNKLVDCYNGVQK